MKGRIVVYTLTGCPHCKRAKAKLKELGLEYSEVDVSIYKDRRDEMIERTGVHTLPQIFFNEVFVGGNSEFQSLSEDELNNLIEKVKNEPSPSKAPQPIPESQKISSSTHLKDMPNEEYSELIPKIRASQVVKSNQRKLIHSFAKSFTGEGLVQYLVSNEDMSRDKAIEVGKYFVDNLIVFSVHPEKFLPFENNSINLYRFIEDSESKALNAKKPSYKKFYSPSAVGLMVRNSILHLYDEFLSEDGLSVDYDGIKHSEKFEEFVNITALLQRVNPKTMTREEKLSFFINIYNALVIHSNIINGFPKGQVQRYKFFNNTKYIIGAIDYSLQDIENGVLRANRKGVGQLCRPFGKSDPRLEVALENHEPFIHFALVCGAKSCPAIKTYTSHFVMRELKIAAAGFLDAEENVFIDGNNVKLSMIFKWYAPDFGKDEAELLQFISTHMTNEDRKEQIKSLVEKKSFKVSYFPYNWSTNK